MNKYFDKMEKIPIIEAEKELTENQEEYEWKIRRLQGIANVMAVKDISMEIDVKLWEIKIYVYRFCCCKKQ